MRRFSDESGVSGGGRGEPPRCWRVVRAPGPIENSGSLGDTTGGVDPLGWNPFAAADAADVAGGGSPAAAVISVEVAGFNYKDALACEGHPGVMRVTPLVPGIDAAGRLLAAAGPLPAGTAVVATGHGLGEVRDGGFATHVRAPLEAVIPLPAGLEPHDAMALGTAGLTAVLAAERLAVVIQPAALVTPGDWLVTGAGGGVGMLAVAVLAAAGHRVVACSRKVAQLSTTLRGLGAAEVVAPADIIDPTPKSLVKGRWVGVVDTVGGPLLADVLRSVRPGGAVAAIGMAGGARLDTTVHPFILRGVTLAGIDAAGLLSPDDRRRLWQTLAELWPRVREQFPVTTLPLDAVGRWAAAMVRGETVGRAVVVP
jgi:acrylyl-CoA reductase (NADPH)